MGESRVNFFLLIATKGINTLVLFCRLFKDFPLVKQNLWALACKYVNDVLQIVWHFFQLFYLCFNLSGIRLRFDIINNLGFRLMQVSFHLIIDLAYLGIDEFNIDWLNLPALSDKGGLFSIVMRRLLLRFDAVFTIGTFNVMGAGLSDRP